MGRAERERERGVRGRDVEGAGWRGIRRKGGAERGLNGGRNGPSPNSSPSHTHSTNHCWGSTAPSNNSSGFQKAGFTQKPRGGDSLASPTRHQQKESRA